jgi:hypothetical protein
MKNISYSCKMAIWSIFAIVLGWPLETHGVTLPPDAENAALLYYQAYILRLDFDDFEEDFEQEVRKVTLGSQPTESVRKYIELCSETIDLTKAAAKIPKCDWGGRYSLGLEPELSVVGPLVAFLREILAANAHILATDGNFRKALDQCLTIRRLAAHVGTDTYMFSLISEKTDYVALRCIQHILGAMPPDTDVLAWLKDQLTGVTSEIPSLTRILEIDAERRFLVIRNDDRPMTSLQYLRNKLIEKTEDQSVNEKIRSLTDEELLARCRERSDELIGSALRILNNKTPYAEKYADLEKLVNYWEKETQSNPFAEPVGSNAGMALGLYDAYVRHSACYNALMAAIDIYLVRAPSEQLPRTMPSGLPKDPFSGQDFEYEILDEGFVLHCRHRDIGSPIIHYENGKRLTTDNYRQYKFKVQGKRG